MRKTNNDADVYAEIQLKITESFDSDELTASQKRNNRQHNQRQQNDYLHKETSDDIQVYQIKKQQKGNAKTRQTDNTIHYQYIINTETTNE